MSSVERTLIATLCLFPEAMPDARAILSPGDFSEAVPAALYAALCAHDDRMQSWDLGTLAAFLEPQGAPSEARSWAEEIAVLAHDAVSPAFATQRAYLVHDAAVKRALSCTLIAARSDLEPLTPGTGDVEDFIAKLDTQIQVISGKTFNTLEASDCGPAAAILVARYKAGHKHSGIDTGLVDLDDKLLGMRHGEFYVIAARPGEGKTALGLQIALNAARAQHASLFLSLEIGIPELVERLVSNVGSIDSHSLRSGELSRDELYDADKASFDLQSLRIHLVSDSATSISKLRGIVRQHTRKQPLSLLVVDYLQLMSQPGSKDRLQEVSFVSRNLKALAKELSLPVIAMSQLSRAAEGVKPTLAHLRESGTIEQDADVVILLSKGEGHTLNADVAKNRHGRTGDVPLTFLKPFFRVCAQAPSSSSEAIYS